MKRRCLLICLIIAYSIILIGCSPINKEIRTYEKQIKQISEISNINDQVQEIYNLNIQLVNESNDITSSIKNMKYFNDLSLESFNNYKDTFSYKKYLSKTKDYIDVNEIISFTNIENIIFKQNDEINDNIINDQESINNFIKIINVPFINVIKNGEEVINRVLNINSTDNITIYLNNNENIKIEVYSNKYVLISINNENIITNYISLFEIDYNSLKNILLNSNFEISNSEYLKIEIYDKDLNKLEVITLHNKINEFINQYKDKEYETCPQRIFVNSLIETEPNPIYYEYIENIKESQRIYLYTQDVDIIKLYKYKDLKLFYFSNQYGLVVVDIKTNYNKLNNQSTISIGIGG